MEADEYGAPLVSRRWVIKQLYVHHQPSSGSSTLSLRVSLMRSWILSLNSFTRLHSSLSPVPLLPSIIYFKLIWLYFLGVTGIQLRNQCRRRMSSAFSCPPFTCLCGDDSVLDFLVSLLQIKNSSRWVPTPSGGSSNLIDSLALFCEWLGVFLEARRSGPCSKIQRLVTLRLRSMYSEILFWQILVRSRFLNLSFLPKTLFLREPQSASPFYFLGQGDSRSSFTSEFSWEMLRERFLLRVWGSGSAWMDLWVIFGRY